MSDVLRGGCLCGAVRYLIIDDPLLADYCHCSRCQRWSGTPAEPSLKLRPAQLSIEQGEDALHVYESDGFAPRAFCRHCGSSMVGNWGSSAAVSIPMGSLDGDSSVRPWCHFNTASKVAWSRITDDLPQFEGLPPAYGQSEDTGRVADPGDFLSGARLSGGCLCGRVRYEVQEPLVDAYYCHCSRCRRFSGADCATNAAIKRESLHILQGEELLAAYQEGNYSPKAFCSICGSSLFGLGDDSDAASVRMGTLDGGQGTAPRYHIFVGSKAPWHVITDTLPQYSVLPD